MSQITKTAKVKPIPSNRELMDVASTPAWRRCGGHRAAFLLTSGAGRRSHGDADANQLTDGFLPGASRRTCAAQRSRPGSRRRLGDSAS